MQLMPWKVVLGLKLGLCLPHAVTLLTDLSSSSVYIEARTGLQVK